MDPYQVLGVNRGDDKVLIKKKYLLLMLKYHPDKVGDQYIEKCKEITAAYAKIMKNEFDEDALIPKKFRELGSLLFSKILLKEAGVSVAPGIGFGEHGENFVRLGLVENEHRIRQASRNIKKVLQDADALKEKYKVTLDLTKKLG